MHGSLTILFLIFFLGLVSRSCPFLIAAGLILLLKLLKIKSFLLLLENQGLETGLLFLMLAILVPLILDLERIEPKEIMKAFNSFPGVLAISGGIIATRLNGLGINLLETQPQIIIGLMIGSILGIIFFKGKPVGPLMAGGVAGFFMYLWGLISSFL